MRAAASSAPQKPVMETPGSRAAAAISVRAPRIHETTSRVGRRRGRSGRQAGRSPKGAGTVGLSARVTSPPYFGA